MGEEVKKRGVQLGGEDLLFSFDKRYPNPVIGLLEKTSFGIEVISVYDESDRPKDPLIPEKYYRFSNDKKVKYSRENLKLVVKELNLKIKNEKQALELALLPYKHDQFGRIIEEKGIVESKEVIPPSVKKYSDEHYVVSYYFHTPPKQTYGGNVVEGLSLLSKIIVTIEGTSLGLVVEEVVRNPNTNTILLK